MKRSLRLLPHLALTGLFLAASPHAFAADLGKANNATALNATGSWTGAVVPGASDRACFSNTITAAISPALGGSLSWAGILYGVTPAGAQLNPGGLVTIAATSGATLTLGASGVTNGSSSQDFTINCNVALGAAQNWGVASGRFITLGGVLSGAAANTLTKTGPGTLALGNAANTYAGKTVVTGGILRASVSGSLGPVPAGYTADQITLNGGALMNNTSDLILAANQGITLGAAGGSIQSGWTRPVTINSIVTGAGGLTLLPDATPGPISLNAANTYTGPTRVGNTTTANSWAWLFVNGSLHAASAVTVVTNGLLGGTGTVNGSVTVLTNGNLGPGGIGQAGTLIINNNASLAQAALNVDLANVTTEGAGINDLLQVNGNLTLAGTITVNVNLLNGSLANGTYRLINYTGTLDASGATLVSSNPQLGATFDLATPGQVNMTIANGTPLGLAWTGASTPIWDTTSTNWADGANPTKFTQGDAVTFDDTGSYSNPVGLYQLYLLAPAPSFYTLFPASVSVNTSNSFVMTSSGTAGRLGGGMALYKGGTGTLTMAHGTENLPNIYTGPTVITNGVLKINSARALGPVTGGAIIATNGGTFDVNGQAMGIKPIVMQGAGFNGQGAVISSGAAQNNALQPVTMTGDTTVGGTGRFDIRGTPADTFLSTGGQPYKLTKVGPQQFSIVGATVDPALGDVDVLQGIFSFEGSSTSLGDPAKTVTVAPNASLQLWATTNQINKQFVFNGGTASSIIVGSGSNTIVGPVTLNADSRWQTDTVLAQYGAVGGLGGLIKSGTAALYLHTANTYLGNTTVSAGTLALGPSGWLGLSPLISVGSGAVLDVTALGGGLYLNTGQTLAGSGTVRGSVTAPTGTALSPGSSPGTLTITNVLTLDSGTATFELGADALSTTANDRIVAGQLAASGVTTLKLVPLGTLDTVNPYTLITNLGTGLPSGSEANFAVSNPSRYTFSVLPTDNTAGKAVQVQVSGGAPASLVWQGNDATNPTLWDTMVTSNWLNGAASDAFFAGDAVLFDDTAIGTTANLVGTVQPSFIRLSNATKPITIGGAGSLSTPSLSDEGGSTTTIANTAANTFLNGVTNVSGTLTFANTGANSFGPGLLVNGGALNLANAGGNAIGPATLNGGALTIANSGVNTLGAIGLNAGTLTFGQPLDTTVSSVITGNGTLVKEGGNLLVLSGASPSFNGPIQVNSGILRVGVANGLGNIAGGTAIASGATLDVNAINLTNELVTVLGTGVGGLGALVNNSGTQQLNAFHNVKLVGDTTFGGIGRWDIRNNGSGNGVLDTAGNAYNLTKVGANYVTLVSTTVDPALGNIDVLQGGFGYEVATTGLGDPTKTLNVASNAYFLIYASANPLNKQIRLQGGSLLYSQNAANTIWGPIELPNAMASIQTDVNLTVTNQISGPGTLQKIGTATLFLTASNNLTSSIVATNGTLNISHPDALGSSGTVYLRRGTATGGTGTKLGLSGGITTPANMTAHITTTTIGGDFRCAMGSDGGGANTWAGPILLNGENIVGFYTSAGNPLIINGNIYGTNGYTGQVFCRGAAGVLVTINGQVNLPTGRFALTDNAVVAVNSVGNVWVTTQSAFGRLVVGANNALCPTANMIIGQPGSAAFLDLNGWTQEIGSLATAGTASSQTIGSSSLTADSTLVFNGTTNSSIYGGRIVDSVAGGTMKVALTVTSGRLQLDAANTYTGNTTISGGTLALGSAGTIATTPVIDVQTGATLDVSAKVPSLSLASGQTLKGNGTVTGSITAAAGATVSPGASIGALTLTGNLVLSAGSTTVAEVDKSATPTCDVINAASITYGGTLQVNNLGPAIALGDSFKLFNASSYSGAFAAISPATPGPGLAWDTSTLGTDGTLRVWTPTLTGITKLPDGNFALTIGGVVGQPYSVLASTDVTLPLAAWTVLTSGTITTSPFVFADLTATNYPVRFYQTSTP